jgi:hypothetical protein
MSNIAATGIFDPFTLQYASWVFSLFNIPGRKTLVWFGLAGFGLKGRGNEKNLSFLSRIIPLRVGPPSHEPDTILVCDLICGDICDV